MAIKPRQCARRKVGWHITRWLTARCQLANWGSVGLTRSEAAAATTTAAATAWSKQARKQEVPKVLLRSGSPPKTNSKFSPLQQWSAVVLLLLWGALGRQCVWAVCSVAVPLHTASSNTSRKKRNSSSFHFLHTSPWWLMHSIGREKRKGCRDHQWQPQPVRLRYKSKVFHISDFQTRPFTNNGAMQLELCK
mgnify:CR=1 FL=1